jgi:hypothetical protein
MYEFHTLKVIKKSIIDGHISRIIINNLLLVFRQSDVTTHTKKPTAQMAHLVFAETQPNTEKPKEPFFSIARLNTEKIFLNLT